MGAARVGVVADRGHVPALVALPLSTALFAISVTPAMTSTRARGLTAVVAVYRRCHARVSTVTGQHQKIRAFQLRPPQGL